jgi:hypothetical protein
VQQPGVSGRGVSRACFGVVALHENRVSCRGDVSCRSPQQTLRRAEYNG